MSSVPQNVIKHKVGLLNLAAELGNVSRACKVMGFSRDTFYRYQSAMAAGGIDAVTCSQGLHALLTMLYYPTYCCCRASASMRNLSHSVSFRNLQ
jgi:hypothetical protein